MHRRTPIHALLLAVVALAIGACDNVGPQKRPTEAPAAKKDALYEVDLTKPEGPMNQMLRAAQERDIELFKASFAPTFDLSKYDENVFRKLRKKVLTAKVAPVPESVQQVSDTEAIVKLRNAKGREIPIRVQKFDDKWLIVNLDIGEKALERMKAPIKEKTS